MKQYKDTLVFLLISVLLLGFLMVLGNGRPKSVDSVSQATPPASRQAGSPDGSGESQGEENPHRLFFTGRGKLSGRLYPERQYPHRSGYDCPGNGRDTL